MLPANSPQPVELDFGLDDPAAPAGSSTSPAPDGPADLLSALVAHADAAGSTAAPGVVVIDEDVHEVGYAGADSPAARAVERAPGDVIQAPQRGYFEDALGSFLYPVANVPNAVTFVIILGISLLEVPLAFAGCLGFAGQMCIFGWLSAVYLSVVQDTAAGQEDLPGIRMEAGPWEDIIVPMAKFIGAFLAAFAPSIGVMLQALVGALPGPMVIVGLAWMPVGVFLMPICILLFAVGSQSVLLRPHVVMTTILRSAGGYLYTWLFLLVVAALRLLPHLEELLAPLGVAVPAPLANLKMNFGLSLAILAFEAYLAIVSMRVIGLYYRHFKHRFTFALE